MNAVGLVVEYNPFHNGHKYHLEEAKKQSNADIVIAVMSGNFLQRGEPAIVSKWVRAHMALKNGADIVFELPYRYATQNADLFAKGAICLLTAAGCQALCFGSESGEIDLFHQTLDFLEAHDQQFNIMVRDQLSKGVSYPKAIDLSYRKLSPQGNILDISKPNNTLGLQYMAAIRKQGSRMMPLTITRRNADYHDQHFPSGTIASATSIRKALFSGKMQLKEIAHYIPEPTLELLRKYRQDMEQFHSWENYWPLLKYKLLQSSPHELQGIHEVEEGIENRLIQTAVKSDSFHSFMMKLKTKRYTWTRLQRVCLHILMNVKRAEMEESNGEYLRLLGMSRHGQTYLRENKKNLGLPLVSKASSNKDRLALDIRATNIYALGLKDRVQERLMDQEFSQPPILV